MDLRWSHEGVSMRAPVRNARLIRSAAYALLGVCAALTLGFLMQLQEPAAVPDYDQCMWREMRNQTPCDAIRPSFETWEYPSQEHYVLARACTLGNERHDRELVAFTRANAGVGYAHNLNFLRMAANQTGVCDVAEPAWRSQAEMEFEMLTAIERDYWIERIGRAQRGAEAAHESAVVLREFLYKSLPAWLPLLLFGWITILVLFKRALRAADPAELSVTTSGVRIDGRTIPRSDIAFLSIEGQCLRVERWSDTPLYSRPLPAEALAHADEICAALGLMDEDESVAPGPAPLALHALLAGHRKR